MLRLAARSIVALLIMTPIAAQGRVATDGAAAAGSVDFPALIETTWIENSVVFFSIAAVFSVLGWLFGKGWLGKILGEDYVAARRSRREFAQKMIAQVSELATQHYWALVNHAGMLARMFEEYLAMVDYHLLLEWPQPTDFAEKLEQLGQETADQSFSTLCRLAWLFDRFQFQGSNTYLLNSNAAGRTCRLLYNSFISELPTDAADAETPLDFYHIIAEMRRSLKVEGFDEPQLAADLSDHDFKKQLCEKPQPLNGEFDAYREWLITRLDSVARAARALRAYNEILSHELAYLYRDWFERTGASEEPYKGAAVRHQWPHVLTSDSLRTVDWASFRSELLAPLGRFAPAKPASPAKAAAEPSGDGRHPPAEPTDTHSPGKAP